MDESTISETGISDTKIPNTGAAPSFAPGATHATGDASHPNMEWDVHAALQLLANRACYLTGAMNAIVALGEGDTLVCKASSGTGAPTAGAQLQIDGGVTSELLGECVATRLPVRCDDAENDARIIREEGKILSVGSVLVAPLIHGNEVVGIFQLTSERKSAFEERDIASLMRLVTAVQTVLEEASLEAEDSSANAKSAERPTSGAAVEVPAAGGKFSSLALRSGRIPLPHSRIAQSVNDTAHRLSRGEDVRRCKGCGFPISPERTLCIDCEAAEIAHGRFVESSPALYPITSDTQRRNWLDEHFYTIGIVLVSLLTVIVLFLWAR
ncbi:MAG: GAF domain-containing protein [Terriglobales bacterium]|jgi:putative methionine-R-sulfoxide reductase with GAF domain